VGRGVAGAGAGVPIYESSYSAHTVISFARPT
jgi:hypothetical protein